MTRPRCPSRAHRTLACSLLAALGANALAATPSPAWEVSDGPVNPESALQGAERGVLYVSDVDGVPDEKDGNGSIARLSPGGDGIESDGRGGYPVSDWVVGGVFDIAPDGSSERLLDLDQGSADIEVMHAEGLLVMPMMNDGKVVAYRLR